MNFLRRFYQQQTRQPRSYSLVDIGQDTVKAAVVLMQPELPEPQVIGYGLAKTGGRDITGGRLEATAVISPVNIALTQAEDSTEAIVGKKVVPDDVIFSLAGRATQGKLFTVRHTRPTPTAPVSARELRHLRQRADRLVRQGLDDLPVAGGQWQALAVNDAGLRLDNHLVLDGVGLTGRELAFSVFGVAAHAGTRRALETLAGRLDLVIANVVSASQALASLVPQAEAIVLDIGLSGTNIGLVRDDALVATGWVPFGGDFFTQTIAQPLSLPTSEAEALKLALTGGDLLREEIDYLEALLERARQRWYEAVMDLLLEMGGKKPLPWRIYLTGGGSLLSGLDRWLRADPMPFSRAPSVSRLGDRPIPTVRVLTAGLDYDLFALTLSLTVGLPG